MTMKKIKVPRIPNMPIYDMFLTKAFFFKVNPAANKMGG